MAKIIIVGPAYPLRGGIANFNEALCSTFNKMGVDSSIVSFSMQYPSLLFPGKSQEATGDAPPEKIEVVSLINSINPFSWWSTANYIRKQAPEKVIIRYWIPFMAPCLGTIARWIKRGNSGIHITAIADNIVPHEKRPGDEQLTGYFVNSCDAFVVMSKSVAEDLKKFDRHKPVKVLPHPVYDIFGSPVSKETARKKLNLGMGDKVVLFFGFIRHYKGLDILLNAFADERIRKAKIKLVIAGEFYDDRKPYLDLIEQHQLKDHVHLADEYIPKDEVKNYFCASDLVVQPYRDATQSGVTQIAYHFGKPMVVTNVGGLPEMVPNGKAGYVTSTDSKGIADAIADFFENNRADTLEAGVHEIAKQFSWEAFAANLLAS